MAESFAGIGSLDDWLREVTRGLPQAPRRYELRCHPGVCRALQRAGQAQEASPPGAPLYGEAKVIVRPDLGPGGWELHGNGELLRSGRLPHEYAIDYGSQSQVPPCVCGLGFDHEVHDGDGLLKHARLPRRIGEGIDGSG